MKPRPFIVCEGGLVSEVFLPVRNPKTKEPFTTIEYDLLDHDIFDSDTSAEDVVTHWEGLSHEAQEYVKEHLVDVYKRFQAAISREKRRLKKVPDRAKIVQMK